MTEEQVRALIREEFAMLRDNEQVLALERLGPPKPVTIIIRRPDGRADLSYRR